MMHKPRRFGILRATAAVMVAVAASAFYFAGTDSKAQTGPNPLVSAARDVHPAGKLLIDVGTNRPAAAPMTMNFVRTPDSGGADGKGRYLIAVNSGFGLMFNSKSKAQQTLSVI